MQKVKNYNNKLKDAGLRYNNKWLYAYVRLYYIHFSLSNYVLIVLPKLIPLSSGNRPKTLDQS